MLPQFFHILKNTTKQAIFILVNKIYIFELIKFFMFKKRQFNSALKVSVLFVFILLLALTATAEEKFTINKNTFQKNENLVISLNPGTSGFNNYLYILKNTSTKDVIRVDCDTICKQEKEVNYIIPESFLGVYALAIFDYSINNYVFLNFSVVDITSKQAKIKALPAFVGEDINGEVKEKRTENSKLIKDGDNYQSIIYARPIHYYKDEKLENIDTRLEEIPFSWDYFKNFDMEYRIKSYSNKPYFSSKLPAYRYYVGDNYVEFELKGANKIKPTLNENMLFYENALQDVDLVYSVGIDKIKEEIILKQPSQSEFVFKIKPKGFFYLDNLIFSDSQNKLIIEKPFAEDYNGNRSEVITEYNQQTHELSLKLDQGFLENAVYPIVIDPTINILSAGNLDGDIQRISKTLYKDITSSYLQSYYEPIGAGEVDTGRGFMEFNTNSIPDNANINSVQLKFDVRTAMSGAGNFSLMQMTSKPSAQPNNDIGYNTIYTDAGNGSVYLNKAFTTTGYKTELLSSQAATDLKNQLTSNWFAVGFYMATNQDRLEVYTVENGVNTDEELIVDYTPIDTTPPNIAIISPLNQSYTVNLIDFNISSNEELAYCNFTIDNWLTNYSMTLDATKTKANYSSFYANEGEYKAKFICSDLYNNINKTESVSFSIERQGILIDMLYPNQNINVNQYNSFDMMVNVSCFHADCNDINVTFDPISYIEANLGAQNITEDGAIEHNNNPITYTKVQTTTQGFDIFGSNYPKQRGYIEFNISGIPDSVVITNAILNVSISNELFRDLIIKKINVQPSLSSAQDIYNNFGNTYFSCTNCKYQGYASFTLSPSDLQNALASNWFALGFSSVSDAAWTVSSKESSKSPQLIVTYTKESGYKGLISTEIGAIPFYTTAASNPVTINLKKDQSQLLTIPVNATGYKQETYTFFAYANLTSDMQISNISSKWNVTIIPLKNLTDINIKDADGLIDLLVNPISGENSNISISATLLGWGCENYNLYAYLCVPSREVCDDSSYDYIIPLTLNVFNLDKCGFSYLGNQSTPEFFKEAGTWKLYVRAVGLSQLGNFRDFTYNQLKATSYPDFINFQQLVPSKWNSGLPPEGINLTNQGNLDLDVKFAINNFSCISAGCTDTWILQGNDLQLDDDNLQGESIETGLNPVFVSSIYNQFPPGKLKVCISDSCNNNIGEKIKTYYHMHPPSLAPGTYTGEINIQY